MASSTLDPDIVTTRSDRIIGKGHGTQALGPSDSSDSGSDLFGAPGLAHQIGLGLTTGNTSDPEESTADNTAGPDVGDANLDSDTDSSGTGERAAAARDTVTPDGADIDTDHIETIPYEEEEPPVESEPALKRRH
ncbi:MAG: hypothetical protein ACXWIN_11005 [Burkholderiaceae bacterium]